MVTINLFHALYPFRLLDLRVLFGEPTLYRSLEDYTNLGS